MHHREPSLELTVPAAFHRHLAEDPTLSVPVAAIQALLDFVEASKATTMSELAFSISHATELLRSSVQGFWPLEAGCSLFKRFFAVTTEHIRDLEEGKRVLLERGQRFVELSSKCRESVADLGAKFIHDDVQILVHSYSRVVMSVLQRAQAMGTRFRVIVAEARPSCSGTDTFDALKEMGVEVKMVNDSGIAVVLEQVDLVLLGSEVVTENGGLVSQV